MYTKEQLALLNAIVKVDAMAAAEYMELLINNAIQKNPSTITHRYPNTVATAFYWEGTKQRRHYWLDVHSKVGIVALHKLTPGN